MGVWRSKPNIYTKVNFIEIPEGDHRVRISKVRFKRCRNDKKFFEITFKVSRCCGKLWYRMWHNPEYIESSTRTFEKFFDAFVRSVNGIVMPTIAEWQQEWAEIEAVILKMNIQLDNMEADRAEIKQLLDSGGYVMHHSESFNRHYSPHYRIIERTIFEQEILPLLEK